MEVLIALRFLILASPFWLLLGKCKARILYERFQAQERIKQRQAGFFLHNIPDWSDVESVILFFKSRSRKWRRRE